MKKMLCGICICVLMLSIISGCDKKVKTGTETQTEAETMSNAYYQEESIPLPQGEFITLGKNKEGNILGLTYENEKFLVYSLAEDYTWKKEHELNCMMPEDMAQMYRTNVDGQGISTIYMNTENKLMIYEVSYREEEKYIPISIEDSEYQGNEQLICKFERSDNRDYFIHFYGLPLCLCDGKTGKMKSSFGTDVTSFDVAKDKVSTINHKESHSIDIYNIETSTTIDSIEFKMGSIKDSVLYDENGIYLFDAQGIQYHKNGTSTWEKIVPVDNTALGSNTKAIIRTFKLQDQSLLMLTAEDTKFEIWHYYSGDKKTSNDTETVSNIEEEKKEITIYMDEPVDYIKEAIRIYEQQDPSSIVNVRIKEQDVDENDAIEMINTELLAGQGPDLLVLDKFPIDTYIDKNVLVDLSDIIEDIDQDEYYMNIINTFKRNDRVYAIPTNFLVPMLWGKKEILESNRSIEELVQYAEKHTDETLFVKDVFRLFSQLEQYGEMILKDNTRESVEDYITSLDKLSNHEVEDRAMINERIDAEEGRYEEFLDIVDGKAELFIMRPRNISDIVIADGVLDACDDTMVAPLTINGQIPYNLSGIMAVNANSKNQEIIKEIIKIALSEEVQKERSAYGVPVNKKAVIDQEIYLTYYSDIMRDEIRRSIQIDSNVDKSYGPCKESWEAASLYCKPNGKLAYQIGFMIYSYCYDNKDLNEILNEYDTWIEKQILD